MEVVNLQSLSVFLTERLTLAAQEILRAVEETVLEYQSAILRRSLQSAELHQSLPVFQEGEVDVGNHPNEGSLDQQCEEMQVKVELSTPKEEDQVSFLPTPCDTVKEPTSPKARLENEQKTEEVFHTVEKEEKVEDVLHDGFMQIKEEPAESQSCLPTETFFETCVSADVNGAAASRDVQDELDDHRQPSAHKALQSKLPLANRIKPPRDKRRINPLGQDRELAQRRERYRIKRPRGISKRPKVGRDRKMEQRIENQRTYRTTTERLPEVVQLNEEPSLTKQLQTSPGSTSDAYSQHGQELSELFQGRPEVHSVVGANLCVVCGRSFGSRGLLKIHLRVHSGEKPYNCHFCDKTFRQSSHLSVHVRIHTGEKPYSCPTCEKRFSDRSARNRHLKVHLENVQVGHC